jgi:hypothetical protein
VAINRPIGLTRFFNLHIYITYTIFYRGKCFFRGCIRVIIYLLESVHVTRVELILGTLEKNIKQNEKIY